MSDTEAKSRYENWSHVELVRETEQGDGIRLMSIQSVAARHDVFMLMSPGGWPSKLAWIVVPEGGSMEGLKRWHHAVRRINVWDLPERPQTPDPKLVREVLQWVVDRCQDEVEAEQA